MKSWIRGIHHSVSKRYLQAYLDEFCYRINRSIHKQGIFDDLMNRMIACPPITKNQIKLDLFKSNRITLEVPMRKSQVNFKPQAFIFRKSRKRIETLLSQLCDQFMIRRNYAKSFDGFKNRLLPKITSLTVIQLIK